MDKKQITFYILSNEADKPQKLVVSATLVRILVVVLVILAVSLVAGIVDYVGLLVQTAENKKLKAENAQLVSQFEVVVGKVGALEASLERVKTFTTKLKLITNVDGEDRAMKLSMGPQPKPNQAVDEYDQPMDQRASVQELGEQDKKNPANKPILEEQKGEIALEGQRDYSSLVIRIDKGIQDSQMKEQSVLDLWELLSERQSLLNATPNIRPARGWMTSRFGMRISPFTGRPSMHAGIDFAAAPGSPVYAPADGVVSFAGYDEGYGKLVSIDHGYGVTTRYGHCAQLYVQVGQRVSRWDVIASVGNTGRSTGPHLHYEVRIGSQSVDPSSYIWDE